MVDVAHRRPDVRVPHVGLHVGQREGPHGERPEGVAEIVEADPLQPRALKRLDVPAPHRRALEVLADRVHEHQIVLAGPPLAPAEAVQRRPGLIDQWHRADLARLRWPLTAARERSAHLDQLQRPVDVAPAQAQELAEPQSGEGRDGEEHRVLRIGGVCREQRDLRGLQHVEVA